MTFLKVDEFSSVSEVDFLVSKVQGHEERLVESFI